MTRPLLEVEDLHVTFSTRRGLVEAVRGASTLSLGEGVMLGLVGETARASPSPVLRSRVAGCRGPDHGRQYPLSRQDISRIGEAISAACTARRWR